MIRRTGDRCGDLIAAYREGLGLAAIAIVREPDGVRICALCSDNGGPDADLLAARWWCRRAADAERLAKSAALRLRRRELKAGATDSAALSLACAAVDSAAKTLGVALQSDREIADEAMHVAARIEAQLKRQHEAGELKSVNRAYRIYRTETTQRGERVQRYDEWMDKYKENLVRRAAATLRQI
jgi:hypothetical protein